MAGCKSNNKFWNIAPINIVDTALEDQDNPGSKLILLDPEKLRTMDSVNEVSKIVQKKLKKLQEIRSLTTLLTIIIPS